MSTPVVIVVRDPDSSNEFSVIGGEVEIFDIDLGVGFDGTPDDEDEAKEWAVGELNSADVMAQKTGHQEVYDAVFEIVSGVVAEYLSTDELQQAFRESDGR